MNPKAVPANIICYMRMLDISMDQMAATLKMSARNLYRRLKKPEDFTLGEIDKLMMELGIGFEELFKGGR